MQNRQYGAELAEYGVRIKKLRESMGMSQIKLAEKSGVSRVQITRIENMQMMPSLETITKIGLAMNVTVNYFLIYDQKIIENRMEKDRVDCYETGDIDRLMEILDTTLRYYKGKAEANERNAEKNQN